MNASNGRCYTQCPLHQACSGAWPLTRPADGADCSAASNLTGCKKLSQSGIQMMAIGFGSRFCCCQVAGTATPVAELVLPPPRLLLALRDE
jgi:hypothetical protein